MTEELKKELKTEIADWWRIKFRVEQKDDICQTISGKEISELCLIIAEPREKQIEIDAKQIRALQKQNGELTDKVKELEAQIEKMKNCSNCRHSRTEYEHCKTDKHEKWEMKEK